MIRCQITPHQDDDGVRLEIEWIEVGAGERIIRTVATEQFVLMRSRRGCAYVTRGGFDLGQMLPGTFWLDEEGHRHFVMAAEAGCVSLVVLQSEVRSP